jgi:plastocyanin
MRFILLSCLVLLGLSTSQAQDCDGTDHTVLAANYSYSPSTITINAGESIAFVNEGGTHNVNGESSTLGETWNNPESFFLEQVDGTAEGVCIGQITLTLPGTYQYDCSIGYHASNGMVGTIIVEAVPGCTDETACNYAMEATEDDGSCSYVDGVCDTCEEGLVVDNDSDDDGVCDGDEISGCVDPLGCNFDSTATDVADCIYFDTDLFLLEENDFINGFDTTGCANGYSAWNSLVVPLGQDSPNSPLTLTLFPAVEDILVENGFETVAQDLATVQISVCGTTMNYDSEVIGFLSTEWDGMGFPNPIYDAYLVPGSSLPIGCPDPSACNFDPCSHPLVSASCEYIMTSEIGGDTALVAGGTYIFTYTSVEENTVEWESDCGEITVSGDSATFVPASDVDCVICVTETSADGCEAIVCQSLSVTVSDIIEPTDPAVSWGVFPNPAQNFVRIEWAEAATSFVISDAQGRVVRTAQVIPGSNIIPLNDLPSGHYLAGPQGSTQRTHLQIIR